ncbi:oxygen-independent coproporphyrinogen III oxidase [Roseivivax marinus]|uniref:oxygen-independent coproporphyrinogen III oxidase n=1 Tax=Roseivivax marinus TaxID=1379903 RepID=UPI00273FF478|nr:oxygen-independent coproporphyrinogen III oxidase [Roseivivax marinus]
MTQQDATSRLLTASVPRYTSYPPANHFSDSVGPDDSARWIAAVPEDTAVSIYLHIPFCRRLCHFCACRTQGTASDRPLDAYVGRLETEIERVTRLIGRRQPVSAVHFGGGTPTILRPDHFARIDAALRGAFAIGPETEMSVEVDPTEIDEDRLDALASMGLTRASIGVQDFDEAVQRAIGRMQSVEETTRAVAALRDRGARSVNVDLIYGLPHQTTTTLRETIDAVTAFAPDRAAIYGYAHVPRMARRQQLIPQDSLPGPAERLTLFDTAQRLLAWAGYVPVGIDHFARPEDDLARAAQEGRLFRNFQGYTTDAAPVLLGFGASALSRFPQGHAQNAAASGAWAKAVDEGRLATARGWALDPEDRARAEIIERIMCDFAVDLPAVAAGHGLRLADFSAELSRIAAHLGDEVDIDAGRLRLTARDGRFARLLAAEFDAFLSDETGRYSRAV